MLVKNFSVYFNGPYAPNFGKLYKGVIVVIDIENNNNTQYMHFAIRSGKVKNTIFKTSSEKLNKIIFNNIDKSVSCIFDRNPKNKSKETLFFSEETYNELKKSIPDFIINNGGNFSANNCEETFELIF